MPGQHVDVLGQRLFVVYPARHFALRRPVLLEHAAHPPLGYVQYPAPNPDVRGVYGNDTEALARHYVTWAYAEHRPTGAPLASTVASDDAIALIALFNHAAAPFNGLF